MALFTVSYRPQNSSQIFGQQAALIQLKEFILNYKKQPRRAALLYGPIGNGKTSSVYALAKELGYEVLELNASDFRDQASISSFLGSALGQQSLFFTPKLVLIDEVDAISGVQDRGCISAIVKAIEKSSFPVILTANDPFESKFKPLQKACSMIEFHKLQYRTIAHALQWVCQQEGISYEEKAITNLARQVDGDLRAALIDLQICSGDKVFTFAKVGLLSDRKRTSSIVSALALILKSSSVDNALRALDDVDAETNEIFLWMDENLPLEYVTPFSLAKAYEHLSRADVFQGRIRRQQHWRFLVYINNLLTAGISSAKEGKNQEFVRYKPTMRLLRQWQAKQKHAHKKEVAAKLAAKIHSSTQVALQQVPYLQVIFRKGKGAAIAEELNLGEEEVEWLGK